MFFVLMIVVMILALVGLVYLLTRFRKFAFIKSVTEKRTWLRWGVPLAALAVIVAFGWLDFLDTAITVLHLTLFWALAELLGVILRKLTGKRPRFYWQGALALLVTASYLGAGAFLNYHVFETRYELTTAKALGQERLRVAQISDSHIGTTFDGEGFARHLERVQAASPDIVVITGDYVDDDTTRADMVEACAALGRLKTTYGVYFVFGNHDRGYFGTRDFTGEDLIAELERNGVHVLEDETAEIGENILLIGRKDRQDMGRMEASQLTQGADTSQYIIMLDHEPNDFDAETKAGADLVLCGHTHGGQTFPLAPIGVAIGANDLAYGLETRGGTSFIVSYGISCWAVKFKTGTYSEFVIVDILERGASA